MNNDNLDLLDLDNGDTIDTLPDVPVFAAPRPKKPWLLLAVGISVIVLATYIIIRTIGDDSSSTIEVDLDAPAIIVDGQDAPVVQPVPLPQPTPVAVAPQPQPMPQPIPQPKPEPKPLPVVQPAPTPVAAPVQATPGVPVRVIEDRKEVTFNPDAAPVKAAPVKKAAPAKKAPARAATTAPKGSWFVQFGSYGTHDAAVSAQNKITKSHANLFQGRQFVILAAVLPNGKTTYRLRVAFPSSGAANGFCQNAKSDGLDCYVAK